MESHNISALLAEKQSALDSLPTLAAADEAVAVVDAQVEYATEGQDTPRRIFDGSYSKAPGRTILPAARIRFTTEIGMSGAAGTAPPRIADLLKACDMAETVNASTSVVYKPTVPTDGGTYAYFEWYTQKKKHALKNAKGNFQLQFNDGAIPTITWEFLGEYVAPADSSFPTGMAYGIVDPPVWLPTTFTLNSITPVVSSMSLDLGNQLVMRHDAARSSNDGHRGAAIVDRNPSGGLDPESVAEATQTFFADWKAGSNRALQSIHGSSAGNKFQLDLTLRTNALSYADRNGIRAHQLGFTVEKATTAATAGDELILTFF